MANQLFDSGRDGFLRGSYSWLTASWVPYVLGSMHPGLLATAVFLSDIPAAVFRARGTYLANRTATTGVADADDTVISAVGSAGAATAVAVALILEGQAGGVFASQACMMVGYIDTASVLPFLPNGGDLQLIWDSGASKIFKL